MSLAHLRFVLSSNKVQGFLPFISNLVTKTAIEIQYNLLSVVVFFTLTDRASTIPSGIRGCQSGTRSAGQKNIRGTSTKLQREQKITTKNKTRAKQKRQIERNNSKIRTPEKDRRRALNRDSLVATAIFAHLDLFRTETNRTYRTGMDIYSPLCYSWSILLLGLRRHGSCRGGNVASTALLFFPFISFTAQHSMVCAPCSRTINRLIVYSGLFCGFDKYSGTMGDIPAARYRERITGESNETVQRPSAHLAEGRVSSSSVPRPQPRSHVSRPGS